MEVGYFYMQDSLETVKDILIIDDEPQICKIFGLKLKLAGYQVISTTSGTEGIDIIRNQQLNLVVLDIFMPRITGIDVLIEVRKFSTIPIIVFTAHPEDAEIVKELGANDCIIKPVNPEVLITKIKDILAVHQRKDVKS